ncbi:MAG: hypothetical protein MUC50_10440 [Myxococcota bacterium]|jgi:hypothetical protein|nr:hypothetical protein [Myxococcota bacterium]
MNTSSIRVVLGRDEGAIMTEAAICLPFFILLWLGLIAVHSLWNARLSAQVMAHARAYEGTAVGRCDGTAQPGGSTTGQVSGDLASEAQSAVEAGGKELFDWSLYLVESSHAAEHIPELFGGPTRTVKGRARILCNSEPRESLGDFIFELLSSWAS